MFLLLVDTKLSPLFCISGLTILHRYARLPAFTWLHARVQLLSAWGIVRETSNSGLQEKVTLLRPRIFHNFSIRDPKFRSLLPSYKYSDNQLKAYAISITVHYASAGQLRFTSTLVDVYH